MMADYDFYDAYDVIQSGQPYSLKQVADTWRNFAAACQSAADQLKGTSDMVTAQQGTPYQNFGARATPVANWMTQVANQANTVGTGLANAGAVGSSAQMEAHEQYATVSQKIDKIVGPDDALSMGKVNGMKAAEAAGAAVLNPQIDKWSAAYTAFNPGTVPPAPVTNGGTGSHTATTSSTSSTSDGPGSTGNTTGTTTSTPQTSSTETQQRPIATDQNQQLPPVPPGKEDYPHSSVIGSDGKDFTGWVKDPRTGYLIDPSSGQEYDPTSGRWVDPVTGKPFGDVTQYSSRLEGLSGGTPGSLALGGGSGSVSVDPLFSLGGKPLFGGAVPPSLNPANPAYSQLAQNASSSMAAKAYAANALAQQEAQQGGRPYVPPMQAGVGGGVGGSGSRARRGRGLTEPESTWTGRTGAAAAKARARAAAAAGEADGSSGQRGYVPGMQAGKGEKDKGKFRENPDWLVEDDVWSSGQRAARGVLGEDR
jgi:hypothetical protein